MYLKEVRMVNFKSFGSAMRVPFKPGFTAITGPNGSGKSNIGDAILFVLGPTSTRLIRAKGMTELIFNGGTVGGKPGKPAKEMEVSLVFDNIDRVLPIEADEVVVTRRVRRAPKRGEPNHYASYVYVNERAASVTDVRDLLLHARISADGYNIVMQGQVTGIPKMSAVERRGILDEISGVAEFDRDIEVSTKRREETEANLQKIEIILGEIRKNLSELKRARDGAEKYAELQKRQTVLKALFAYRRKEDIERQVQDAKDKIASYEEEKRRLTASLETLRVQHETTLKEYHEAEAKLADIGGEGGEQTRQQIQSMQAEAVRLEERRNHAKSEARELSESKSRLGAEFKKIEKDLRDLGTQRAELEAEHQVRAKELASAEKELKGLRELAAESSEGAMRVHHELAKLKADYEETTAEQHKLHLEKDRFAQRTDATKALISEIEEAQKTCEFELKDVAFQLKELGQESKATAANVKELEAERLTVVKRQAAATQEMSDLETALRRLTNEHAQLKALEQASQTVGMGLNRAVDAILDAKRKSTIKGIHGTIAELGKVDPKYDTALQQAAGNRLMCVVVETDGVAAQCIEYLRSHNLGRATFLPLNKMIPTSPRGKALMVVKDEQSCGFALDLISYNKKYENAFAFVFGDTVVMKTLDAARRHMGGVRLVTLEGDLLEASGAMVGGSLGKKDTIKFAGKDVDKLAELEGKIAQTTEHIDALNEELVEIRKKLQKVETDLGAAKIAETGDLRVRDLDARQKEFETKLAKTKDDLAAKREELVGLEDALAGLDKKIIGLDAHVKDLEQRRDEKNKLLVKGTKKEIAERITSLEEQGHAQKTRVLEIESTVQTLDKKLELVSEQHRAVRDQLQKVANDVEKLEGDAKQWKGEFNAIEEKLNVLTKADAAVSGKAKQVADQKEKLAVRLKDLEGKMDTVNSKLDTHTNLIFQVTTRLPQIEESLGEVLVEIQTLKLEPPAAEEKRTFDEAKRELNQVERSMADMGAVNMTALTEYDAQMAREKDLIDETKRLEDQRANLIKVVEEIVQKKKENLMRVFAPINENFAKVYAKLTNGGQAYLELENAERPFEGGLLIKAQPKGKKFLSLQALSGGEQSITTLAFIFAIQDFEPSPFYYLDEIDQNLDAVNAEAVALWMKDHSKSAQFLCVSLRKVTLKEAAHIYGVTQAGNGLSQMIANFDINLVSEKGELVAGGRGGTGQMLVQQTVQQGGTAPPGAGAGSKGIEETVKDMLKVEVDK
ncbi:MAG: chromosome segregation protein SMC [Euryarchaeota archaeon]|nr:chromosome segregation protein SMC [Euryarchaeota archaeon]